MNIVLRVFGVYRPPCKVIFHKTNHTFTSGETGVPYNDMDNTKAGTLRWTHNVKLRYLNIENKRPRVKLSTSMRNGNNSLKCNSFWPGPDTIDKVTEYDFDCQIERQHILRNFSDLCD